MRAKYDRWFLKEVLDLKQIKKLFGYFAEITGLDVALFDSAGHELLATRKDTSVCRFAKNGAKCREYVCAASQRASELGEPYIVACGCGLIMCFSPIMDRVHLIGSIACGPAVLWDADEVALKEFSEKTGGMNIDADIRTLFQAITPCSCASMTSAAQILFIIVNSLTKEHSAYMEQRARITEQQAKITELIISQKSIAGTRTEKTDLAKPGYPIERERELVECVQNGKIEQAKIILNTLLGEIFSFADGNLDTIKARLFELTAFFSRAAVESGASLSDINQIIVNSYSIFLEDPDFEHICFLTAQTMEEFAYLIGRNHIPNALSEFLSRALDFIAINYMEELTLKKVADAVIVSAFYLSHLFRKEMNTTFSDYLCKVRIEKAKGFLKNENSPRIQEISEKTGFNDPNYFAKSFKKLVGVTPREYKKFLK